jgi:hypothetical protein
MAELPRARSVPSMEQVANAVHGSRLQPPCRRLALSAAVALAAAAAVVGALAAARNTSGAPATDGAAAGGRVVLGPGPVAADYRLRDLGLQLRDAPNRASKPGAISIRLHGAAGRVVGARVQVTLTMLDMDMGSLAAVLPQAGPGEYRKAVPVLGMGGRWRIAVDVTLRDGRDYRLSIVDRMAQ